MKKLTLDNIEQISSELIKEIETLLSGELNEDGDLIQYIIPSAVDSISADRLIKALPKIQEAWAYIEACSRIIYNIKVISAIAGELHIHCGQLLYPIYHLTSDKEAYINYMAWYRDNMARINSVRYDTIAPKPTDNL
jgi:hypothetical protein